MCKQLGLYKIWAPDDALWTQWAKPVVFTNIQDFQFYDTSGLQQKQINWISYERETMLIADLPGKEAIEEGVALAAAGYRPIPLYNGVPGPKNASSSVPMDEIVKGLVWGGQILPSQGLSSRGNPVFLLDSNRYKPGKKKPGTFDNRWRLVPQDMPSADYLKKSGIKKITVRTKTVQSDLGYILYQYQKAGIVVYTCDQYGTIQKASSYKPGKLGLFYRFMLILGLSRSATGGFGMMIPESSSASSSGYRGHRYG